MEFSPIAGFDDFCRALARAGFAMSGGNCEGIFSLSPYFDTATVRAHSGVPETDPWCWRIRAVTQRREFALGKFFLNKNGWITRDWLPCFLAVRRQGRPLDALEDWYRDGLVSRLSLTLYQAIRERPALPYHLLKDYGGGASANAVNTALAALERGLFITVCGEAYKLSAKGEPYGWPSVAYCTMVHYFGEEPFAAAAGLSPDEAETRIRGQIFALNPLAEETAIRRFIRRT